MKNTTLTERLENAQQRWWTCDRIEGLATLLDRGCSSDTKRALRDALRWRRWGIDRLAILSGVRYSPKSGWSFHAGQDYSAGIRTVREVILGRG